MRESQMKKIIAAAVATAFVAPAFAADVSLSGASEAILKDSDGTMSTELDYAFSVGASTETANGLSLKADINIGGDATGETSILNEGGNSLTISGAFGSVDIGDTSGAVDAINGVTESGKELSFGTVGDDASVLWTLPTLAEGLTVYVSANTDENTTDSTVSTAGAGSGVAAKYSNSGLTIGYGQTSLDSGVSEFIANVTYSFNGIGLAYEGGTDEASTGVKTDVKNFGATYTMGDVMVGVETSETSSAGSVSADKTAYTIQYSLGGGVTAWLESSDDAKAAASNVTAAGLEFKF
jgi:hypothetical protein